MFIVSLIEKCAEIDDEFFQEIDASLEKNKFTWMESDGMIDPRLRLSLRLDQDVERLLQPSQRGDFGCCEQKDYHQIE